MANVSSVIRTEISARAQTGHDPVWPNFFLVGAARAGTTALHEYLIQHPSAFMSDPKEPHYFAFAGQRPNFTGPEDELFVNRPAVTDRRRYLNLFAKAHAYDAVGDASVSYLYYPKAPERIHEGIPAAKIICILRDPVERAFSSYMYLRFRMREPLSSFAEALAAEDQRIAEGWHHLWHYKRMGLYTEQIQRYYDLFPAEQIRIIIFDDFLAHAADVLRETFAFIGVDDSFVPHFKPAALASGLPKNRLLQKLIVAPTPLHALLRKIAPKRMLRRVANANVSKVRVEPTTARELALWYQEDIRRLCELLDCDLTHWTKKWLA